MSHTTRSKAATLAGVFLPLKKVPKAKVSKVGAKKNPAVVPEIIDGTPTPQTPSESDVARMELASLKAAGEAAAAKRLKDQTKGQTALVAAAKKLEDCVLQETAPKELKETD